ncbi:MAG: DUF4351 domain-containing protein [Thermosynechococcaceae cyanobacterium]
MAKNPFDAFSKQLLEETLSPYGAVETSREVPGEAQFIDVYFEPNPQPTDLLNLGLLGRIAQTPCLLEPFRNQPTASEIRSCLLKLFQVHGDYQRKSRRKQEPLQESELPHLWILASSASDNLLNGFGALPNNEWETGIYFLPPAQKTTIIAINQLPGTPETLLLRILGKGQTQQQAIAEVLAIDTGDPRRSAILRLITNWKISIEITGQLEAEEDLMATLSQAYLEWEQQTKQAGEQDLILRLLTRRIGNVSPNLQSQIQALSLMQLESLGEALLDFSEPADLTHWLQNH